MQIFVYPESVIFSICDGIHDCRYFCIHKIACPALHLCGKSGQLFHSKFNTLLVF